jgi:hypothetical protein
MTKKLNPGWERYFLMIEAAIAAQTVPEWRENLIKTLAAEKHRAATVKTARPPRSRDLRGISFDGTLC